MQAGLLLIPQGVGMAVALQLGGALTDRIAPRPIVLFGLVLTGVSTYNHTGLGAVMVPAMAITVRGLTHDMIPRAPGTAPKRPDPPQAAAGRPRTQ
jgi:MFS family permease